MALPWLASCEDLLPASARSAVGLTDEERAFFREKGFLVKLGLGRIVALYHRRHRSSAPYHIHEGGRFLLEATTRPTSPNNQVKRGVLPRALVDAARACVWVAAPEVRRGRWSHLDAAYYIGRTVL
jgi:hypothetical protein